MKEKNINFKWTTTLSCLLLETCYFSSGIGEVISGDSTKSRWYSNLILSHCINIAAGSGNCVPKLCPTPRPDPFLDPHTPPPPAARLLTARPQPFTFSLQRRKLSYWSKLLFSVLRPPPLSPPRPTSPHFAVMDRSPSPPHMNVVSRHKWLRLSESGDRGTRLEDVLGQILQILGNFNQFLWLRIFGHFNQFLWCCH